LGRSVVLMALSRLAAVRSSLDSIARMAWWY